MMSKKIFILLLCGLLGNFFCERLTAQVPDSLQKKIIPKISIQDSLPVLDTAQIIKDTLAENSKNKNRKPQEQRFLYKVFKKDYPNPKMAVFSSMVFPGMGQIYNGSWLKVPIVWGGMAWAISSSIKNTRGYREFRDVYIAELDDQTHKYSLTNLDAADFKRIRDGYDNNRQVSYIMIFVLYAVAGAEAFVDAHLSTFDVSEDLTLQMKLKPIFETDMFQMPAAGIGLSFQLTTKKQIPSFHF